MAASSSAKVCYSAILTSGAFILQVSCVFFPVIGTVLSMTGTMLLAVAGFLLGRRAVMLYAGAGLLLLAVSPRNALEFLTTTGFVGLTLGMRSEMKRPLSLLAASLGMFAGLCGLTYLFGTAALGGIFSALPAYACLPVFAVFSAAYSILWHIILKKLLKKPIFRYSCFK